MLSANRVIGLSAIVFSLIYLVSDIIELAQGGFSTFQLVLTYVAEAAIPLFVLGLYAAQRPRIGSLGLAGAVGYGYVYVFFTSTVVIALVDAIPTGRGCRRGSPRGSRCTACCWS